MNVPPVQCDYRQSHAPLTTHSTTCLIALQGRRVGRAEMFDGNKVFVYFGTFKNA